MRMWQYSNQPVFWYIPMVVYTSTDFLVITEVILFSHAGGILLFRIFAPGRQKCDQR
jgi:hypothetical protein